MKSTPAIRQTISAEKVSSALKDLTGYILSASDFSLGQTVLVGIQSRGVLLANRIAYQLKKEKNIDVPTGAIDITLYRDDFSTSGINPVIGETHLDFDLDGKEIVLVDDVLFTGRTIRAALDQLMDYGRPRRIQLVVLVDRGHRELPIAANMAALTLATKRHESVNLHLEEVDGKDEIVVCDPL